jgi:hypothetical protein
MNKGAVKKKHQRNKTDNLEYLRQIHNLADSPSSKKHGILNSSEKIEFDNYLVNKTINKEKST